jgi:hypothetical protein
MKNMAIAVNTYKRNTEVHKSRSPQIYEDHVHCGKLVHDEHGH